MIRNKALPPVHPGKFLQEILEELCITQAAFARDIGLSPMRISHVIKGDRPVTAEMALLFGKAFGQSPRYWLNLQADYDLKIAERKVVVRLSHIHRKVAVEEARRSR
jgi:addiction module HigA family antidote